MSEAPVLIEQHRSFGGSTAFYRHESLECGGAMRFAVHTPPQAQRRSVPVLYFLSGLTCTEENFTVKAGAQRVASELGLMLVAPDTSPRGAGFAGEDESYDFGTGAGFYVDATEEPWRRRYRMYSYVTKELPAFIARHFPADAARQGIFGHSMGGHGALICALRNPRAYRSVSAFAPIAAPIDCPWGEKAFAGYLGPERKRWEAYDATRLVAAAPRRDTEILIDQGGDDPFLAEQLKPERFAEACRAAGQPLRLRMQAGYDHSYYFISSFIEDHLRHHAAILAP